MKYWRMSWVVSQTAKSAPVAIQATLSANECLIAVVFWASIRDLANEAMQGYLISLRMSSTLYAVARLPIGFGGG